ncbi:PAS domain S-box protein [Granulicella tundricola]|uniref:histidine kinase n=1 Tax=Granulicella tundricola (strain ATCC BAA-1859 / DSM 23138 / MP5ACTX9) TaxID=1198114 RepID=E8WXS0_GRATM|nr:PAS domain S-box protein [Granulicella tundricola]ADW69765.1 multi-sensor signal transduction histidine kinase [Granulicella tundricola MP5ACTX9]
MKTLSRDEALRLEALEEYEVIGTAPDSGIDDLTQLAAQICGTSMAGISLVGADAVYFQSRFGPGPPRLPRGSVPCETAILGDSVYEIPDARYHRDYRPDGIMVAGRVTRFYAGAPLAGGAGINIGCLFVQDSAPRTLSETQKSALQVLARQVTTRFELNARVRHMDRAGRSRLRVESALSVERNFVSAMLDTVGALVLVRDTAGRIVRFNRTCEAVSGYDLQSMVGRYVWEKLIPENEVAESVSTFERIVNGSSPTSFENHWLRRDGSLRRIAWSATALVDPQGQTNFIISTGIDVTEQREAEDTLRESEARYRQLIEGSLGMVCTHDLEGKLLSVNLHGAQSVGYEVEELIGRNLALLLAPSRRPHFQDYLRQVQQTGEAQGRLYLTHRNGSERIIAYRNKLIEIAGREPYVLGFGVDISEQVQAEGKLRNLIDQSNSILESVGDGIYGLDLEGRVTVVNPAAAQMLGYKPHELLGRNMHEVIHHTRADGSAHDFHDCAVMRAIDALDTMRVSDEVFWRKDGTCFPVEYVARPQIEASEDGIRPGRAVGVVVAFADTTERRQLDRMKDEFISTVSHELRTPLTSLRAALGLVTGGALATRPDKMKQMLQIAIANTDRLVRLVNDILDIERIGSGSSELRPVMSAAEDLLERATKIHQGATFKHNVRFRVESNDVRVWADPDRILQALSNLISNAIKFSPPEGEITLTARYLDEQEAQFDISDQGPGIPQDRLENIFERFQQVDASDTRAMGGTGLGLAICRSIIAQHGGRIWASSPPGKGATFHFTLPTKAVAHLR